MKPWTTFSEINQRLKRQWVSGQLLADYLNATVPWQQQLPIRAPSPRELGLHFELAQDWLQELKFNISKTPFTIEWRDINHRLLGRNQLPKSLLIPSLEELIDWLGHKREKQRFKQASEQLLARYPELRPWVEKYPHLLLQHVSHLEQLTAIISWRINHPNPSIYLRQLSIEGIDTKFIEQHKKILADWLDILLPVEQINQAKSISKQFASRYGFLDKPEVVRFRILDASLSINGLTDISIPCHDFLQLNLNVDTVFICENDINALTFPTYKRAIVLFGRGYGLDFLAKAAWLHQKRIIYWGDIDTHGFAILNQCRHALPQTESFLMDETTLLNHQEHWTIEPKPFKGALSFLTAEEQSVLEGLQHNRWGNNVRLEQEYLPFEEVLSVLSL